MKITLVRHIKTTAPDGMCYGQTDVSLPAGFEVIHDRIAETMGGCGFDAIYASPLQRCAMLAMALAGDQRVFFDDRLKELDFGRWEGRMWHDIAQTTEARLFFEDFVNVPALGGESYAQLIVRVKSFFNDLVLKNDNHVLIVTHGGPIRAFYTLIDGVNPADVFQIKVDYGQAVVLTVDESDAAM